MMARATSRPGVRKNPAEIGLRKANKSDAFWASICCTENRPFFGTPQVDLNEGILFHAVLNAPALLPRGHTVRKDWTPTGRIDFADSQPVA
jgi:hypothetical protein